MGHKMSDTTERLTYTHTPYPLVALNQVEETGMETHGGLRVLLAPMMKKTSFFGVSSRRSCRSS